jgi:flagellar biosynthetic protein FlhB
MLASAMDEPRTEQATPQKLARARREGLVPRSPDLTGAAVLLALLGALGVAGPSLLFALRELMSRALRAAAEPAVPALQVLGEPLRQLALLLLYPLLAVAFAAFLAGFLQVGPLLAARAIAPDLRRLDPLERLRAFVSQERLLDACWGAFKLGALLFVAAFAIAHDARGVLSLATGSVPRGLSVVGAAMVDLALRVAIAAAVLGAADLVYRRVRHKQQLRMGRRELALELRESHGSPEQRERRKRLQDEARAQAELAEIDRASVLLLDGTGRALALRFDPDDMSQRAPLVVAKAQGRLVARLQSKAAQAGVPARFAPALVGLLFRLELTEQVPPAYYDGVAELFADIRRETP